MFSISCLLNSKYTNALISSFHSMFLYDINRKKIDSPLGLLSLWSWLVLLMAMYIFFKYWFFSYILKMCMWGELVCQNCPSLSKCVYMWVALPWKGVLSKMGSHLATWAEMGSGNPWPWTEKNWVRNSPYLFLLIFLKCVYGSHLLMINIRSVLSLYVEVQWYFVTRNMP